MYRKKGSKNGTTISQENIITPQVDKGSFAVGYALAHTQQLINHFAAGIQVSEAQLAVRVAAFLSTPAHGSLFRVDDSMPGLRREATPGYTLQAPLALVGSTHGIPAQNVNGHRRGRRRNKLQRKRSAVSSMRKGRVSSMRKSRRKIKRRHTAATGIPGVNVSGLIREHIAANPHQFNRDQIVNYVTEKSGRTAKKVTDLFSILKSSGQIREDATGLLSVTAKAKVKGAVA